MISERSVYSDRRLHMLNNPESPHST